MMSKMAVVGDDNDVNNNDDDDADNVGRDNDDDDDADTDGNDDGEPSPKRVPSFPIGTLLFVTTTKIAAHTQTTTTPSRRCLHQEIHSCPIGMSFL